MGISRDLQRFVGRTDELAALRRALATPPAIVIVEGEAGVGKSRLVTEALSRLSGTRLSGGCEPVQEPFPLGPVLDAVRGHADLLPPAGELNSVTGALVPYLPEAAGALPPAPPPLGDQQSERHRLFRAVVALLGGIGPATLVLEDMHWADPGTSHFVTFLASRLPPELTVVLTLRSEARDDVPIWEAVNHRGPAVRIALAPLSRGEVRELAQHILDSGPLPERFVTSLVDATAGIPFVIDEVLRASDGGIPHELPVPTALRDLLLQRWAGLDDETRDVLSAAAVLGATPDETLLAGILGDSARVARALSRGLAAGLLHEQDGQCRFRHALAWQVIYEALPLPSRRWLHLRAAQVLEQGGGLRPVARLAHHYRQAGAMAAFVRSAEEAADLAVSHGDHPTAASFLHQAGRAPGLGRDDRVRLAGKLAHAAVEGLAQDTATPLLAELLTEAGLDPPVRGELRFMLGRLLRQQGEAERGYREIERAVEDLAGQPALQARALAILSVPDIVVARPLGTHLARAEQARQAAARSGDPTVRVAVDIARTSLSAETGAGGTWSLVDELRGDTALLTDPHEHARACFNWAQAALHRGELDQARTLLADARRIIGEVAYFRFAGLVDMIAAWVDLAAGRWVGIEERARLLVREPSAFTAAALDAQFLLGAVLALHGDVDEAETYLREVVATADRLGAFRPLVPARARLARLLVETDRPQEAVEEATRALDAVRAKGLWACAPEALLCLLDALARLGRVEEARPVVDEVTAGLGRADVPAALAELAQCRAALPGEDAEWLHGRARRRYASLGLAYRHADATARLGLCRGDAALLEAALHSLDAMGARRAVTRVCRTMRELGLPVPYPWRGGRRSYGSALSPREREVATLAAAGTTNQEIAERLCLSRRTVESHVANALRKLGARSRRDLSELLASLPG